MVVLTRESNEGIKKQWQLLAGHFKRTNQISSPIEAVELDRKSESTNSPKNIISKNTRKYWIFGF
jgi:hypothetical protein